MKKLLFVPAAVAALWMASSNVIAQDAAAKSDRPQGRPDPAERLKMMSEKLGLSEEQKTKVQEVFARTAEKGKELRKDTALSNEDRRAKMQELRKGEMEEIKAILTPEQQEKMKELRPGRGERPGKAN